MIPSPPGAAILVAQHLYEPPAEYPEINHREVFWLGFVMGDTVKAAGKALDTNVWDKNNAHSPIFLSALLTLRTSEVFENMETLAHERGVRSVIGVSDGSPVITELLKVLVNDLDFVHVGTPNGKRPLYQRDF